MFLRSSRCNACISEPFRPACSFQSNFAEARALYERGQAIEEKALGPEHPDLATTLHHRAALLKSQVGQ